MMKTQTLTALIMIAGMASAAAPALADQNHDCGDGSCIVYVGYADNLHSAPPPGTFPNPWQGSASVDGRFFGNNGPWDAGAIRIFNKGPDVLHVNGVSVTMWGPPTPGVILIFNINPWSQNNNFQGGSPACSVLLPPGGVDIPPEKNAIFTQTCNFNFDTSDIPAPPQVTCKNDKVISEVDISFGTYPATRAFYDVPQILNTGGIDVAACKPQTPNESHNWVNITDFENLPPFP